VLTLIPKNTVDQYYRAVFLGGDVSLAAMKVMCSKIRGIPVDVAEIKHIVAQLKDIPIEEIRDSHPDVQAMTVMTVEEIADTLRPGNTRRTRYWETLKYWEKVQKIVWALDKKDESDVSIPEAKLLFAKLLDVPESAIPDDHASIMEFAGLSLEALMKKLYAKNYYAPSPALGEEEMALAYGDMHSAASNQWLCGPESMRASGGIQDARVMNLKIPASSPVLQKQREAATSEADQASRGWQGRTKKEQEGTAQDITWLHEAAQLADVDIATLPNGRELREVVQWLFALLVDEPTADVAAAKLIVTCKIFDEKIPISVVNDTLAAVNAGESLTARSLCNWVVMMFGDSSEDSFLREVLEFGEAAKTVRGLRFSGAGK